MREKGVSAVFFYLNASQDVEQRPVVFADTKDTRTELN